MNRVHHRECPVCGSKAINPIITIKDHSVSGEDFVLWQCSQCALRFTQDAPDAASIGPYYQSEDYISHTNTSKGLVSRVYQRVRRLTLQQKASLVKSKTVQKGSLLDLGAGIGAFVDVMQSEGWAVQGIEPDSGARARAKELYRLDLATPESLYQLPPGSFDAITMWHVLEHVHDLQETMKQLRLLLKREGRLFIAVPNYRALDADIYRTFWAAYDVPRHLYHFAPSSIEALARRHGMRVLQRKPMWFDAFYISLLSSKYRNGKTGWLGAGISGLRSNMRALFNREACSSIIYILGKD